MRKSFILSLVMVVVLIASLATATFAWYTAQTTVQATDVTVVTNTVDKNIVIKNAYIDDLSYTAKTVTMTMGTPIDPMIPTMAPVKDSTTLYAFTTTNQFVKFNLDDGKVTSKGNAAPSTLTQVDGASGSIIYIGNTGSSDQDYKVSVDITNVDANNGLRVALFVKQGAEKTPAPAYTDDDYKLVGVWAPESESVYYVSGEFGNGSGVDGGVVTGAETAIAASASTAPVLQSGTYAQLPEQLEKTLTSNDQYKVIAWFEGGKITNNFQGKSARFAINFSFGSDGVGPAGA